MSDPTLHPHLCGACESPIKPFRSAETGRQCQCAEPVCPKAVPADALCFFAKDPIEVDLALDQEARLKGLDVLSELAQRIGAVESSLAFLTGFVDGDPLAAAIVGSLGIRATEMQEQIAPLRQAMLDIPELRVAKGRRS